MGYLEQSIGPNEALIYKARFHWLYYAAGWVALILLVLTIGWIVIYTETWIEVVLLAACAIGLLLLLRSMLPLWTTEIGVTNHRLIVKRGWLSRSTEELQLKAIEKVNFTQGFVGRLFGFGNVDVHGTGMEDLHVPAVSDPLSLLRAIEGAASPSKASAGNG